MKKTDNIDVFIGNSKVGITSSIDFDEILDKIVPKHDCGLQEVLWLKDELKKTLDTGVLSLFDKMGITIKYARSHAISLSDAVNILWTYKQM
jgi:hypothetical protein